MLLYIFDRKEEYKIEVLIPPNISDPLNLNAEDDSDYEAKLISPLVKKKKVILIHCTAYTHLGSY